MNVMNGRGGSGAPAALPAPTSGTALELSRHRLQTRLSEAEKTAIRSGEVRRAGGRDATRETQVSTLSAQGYL